MSFCYHFHSTSSNDLVYQEVMIFNAKKKQNINNPMFYIPKINIWPDRPWSYETVLTRIRTIFDSFPYIWELGAPILKEIIEIFLNVFPEFTGCGNKILGEEVIQKYNLLCKKPLC